MDEAFPFFFFTGMKFNVPRLLIASHKGGAGKTLFSIGLIALLKKKGFKVSSFKKGPDYIDAEWLSRISEIPCRNLDLFFFDKKTLLFLFYNGAKESEIAIIEGNRGLYDGVDVEGTNSTARLATLLKSPVILVLDCTKSTRSMAALVKGFVEFEQVSIKGVILNKIARPRHEKIIRESIERYTPLKVLGVLPKLKHLPPERHLGLITAYEYDFDAFLSELVSVLEKNLDLEEVLKFAKEAQELEVEDVLDKNFLSEIENYKGVKIGVIRDEAFQFYYPENLEILKLFGAELIFLNSMKDKRLPEIHGLYVGGGFPEVFGERISENKDFLKDIKEGIEEGLPVYVECGGLMFMGSFIEWSGRRYPMVGVLPMGFEVKKKPQGHGYVIAEVIENSSFYRKGEKIIGHEFHYSKPCDIEEERIKFAFKLQKGTGVIKNFDGIIYKNLFASYTHVHAFGVKFWAERFLKKAWEFKNQKKEV